MRKTGNGELELEPKGAETVADDVSLDDLDYPTFLRKRMRDTA
jgi:hypothetical protein